LDPYAKHLGGLDALKKFSDTSIHIRSLIRGLSPAQLKRRTAPGKWSIQQIIQHLADNELVACCRTRWIAFEENPVLIPFDQNKWAQGREREREPIAETLERLRWLRRSHLRFFRNLSRKDLRRTAFHTARGLLTLKLHLETIVGHDLNHLAQIRHLASQCRKGKQSRKVSL
jgi:hypothetical protein